MSRADELPPREQRFVEEYLLDLNGTQAAIRAGYAPRSADVTAARLLGKARVAAAVAAAKQARAERVEITTDKVLERWWDIATADPNELIEYRRCCCRHCWGEGFGWQETPAERAAREQAWNEAKARAVKAKEDLTPFEVFPERGGVGFDARRDPNTDCPECWGEGHERAFPKDTRTLSRQARALYAGVKVTKDGLEIKMNSQEGALAKVAQHLGMLKEIKEHSGPGGGPIPTSSDLVDKLAKLTPEERAAVRAMALKLEGSEP